MKISLLFLLCLSVAAKAAPFLVCDPYAPQTETGLNVTTFVISGLSAQSVSSPALVDANGQSLHFDLASIPLTNGTKYHISVTAVNGYEGVSDPATLDFTKGVPIPPGNLRISPL